MRAISSGGCAPKLTKVTVAIRSDLPIHSKVTELDGRTGLMPCSLYVLAGAREEFNSGGGQHSSLAGVADGVGFEPTVGVNPRRFSRPLP